MSDPQSTVTLVIDERSVTAPKGENLVEAARRVGIDIPVFCYHRKLSVVGACRMCLVEIEKMPKPQAACTMPVAEGMVVRTQSKKAVDGRSGVIEFLLANHPLDCPICDKGGECPLQDNSYGNGPPAGVFREAKRDVPIVTLSPLVMLDMERCIQCYRCTRFSAEIGGDAELAFVNRGADIMIAPVEGTEYRSVFSGNVTEICPVGALMSRPYRFKARPWDLQSGDSVCTLCGCGCAITANVREEADPVASQVGWNLEQAALATVVPARVPFDPRSVPLATAAAAAAVNASPKNAHVVRYLGRESDQTSEGWLCDRGRYGFDATRAPDRLTSPLARVARGAPLAPVSWEEAFARVAEGLRAAGASVGALAGPYLTLEEAFLLQRLVRGLGSQNLDGRAGWTQSAPAVLARAGSLGTDYEALEKAGAIVLVATDLTEELPIASLRVRKAALRGVPLVVAHWRPVRSPERGAVDVRYAPGEEASLPGRLRDLPAVRDAKGRVHVIVGEEVLHGPVDAAALLDGLAGLAAHAAVGLVLRGSNARGVLEAGMLPGWLPGMTPAPAGGLDARGMLEAAAGGRLQALLCVGADPAADFPDTELARKALSTVPFLVSHELYPTATTRMADVVLPAAGFDEKDGTIMNVERRVQRVRRFVDAPGLAMADGRILARLGKKLGLGFGYTGPADIWAQMHAEAPGLAPVARVSELPTTGALLPAPAPVPPVAASSGAPVPAAAPSAFPLRVATGRMLYDGGTLVSRSGYLSGVMPSPFVALNPADASSLRVADGAAVSAVSTAGRLALRAKVTAEVPAGVAFLPLGFAEAPLTALGDPSRSIYITLEPRS